MNSFYRRFLFEGQYNYHIYFDERGAGLSPMHHHDFHHCVYITQGQILQTQYGEQSLQQAGECFFSPAGVDHSVQVFENTKYFCLSFSQNIADILFSHISSLRRDFRNLPAIIKVPDEMQKRLVHCLNCLTEEQNFDEAATFQTAHFLAVSALLIMLRNEFISHNKATPVLNEETSHTDAEIIRCIQHINTNYDQPLTVDGLSRISTLSRSNFCKSFRQYTGKSVKEFITELRINQAIRFINTGDLSLQEVAEKVGYTDFSTFYRNFIQITGFSPAKYKESAGLKAGSHNESERTLKHGLTSDIPCDSINRD